MDFISLVVLAFIQGISEWFPISSSGHLALMEMYLGMSGSLLLEVTLHFGTLMAVFVYFSKEIIDILKDIISGRWKTPNSRLGFLLLIASIPAGLLGFILRNHIGFINGNLFILGSGWLVTSVVLFIGSFSKSKNKNGSNLSYVNALGIGLAQVLAFIPGVSRSGMTISSGLFAGLKEKQAILFSYLLAIPVIMGANLINLSTQNLSYDFIFPTLICFFVSLVFMNLSFKYILNNRKNLKWFGIYTAILGIVLIISNLF